MCTKKRVDIDRKQGPKPQLERGGVNHMDEKRSMMFRPAQPIDVDNYYVEKLEYGQFRDDLAPERGAGPERGWCHDPGPVEPGAG